MNPNILVDIIGMHQDLMRQVENDPEVLSIEMLENDHDGTYWHIHLRDGRTLWTGTGVVDNDTSRTREQYEFRSSARPRGEAETNLHATEIEEWIRERYPELDDWSVGDDIVLYGKVQAGKTERILSMIWITQHIHEKKCVLVLANMAASYNQVLGKNAVEFNEMLLEQFGERSRPFLLKAFGCRGRNMSVAGADYKWLCVAMGNPAQLKRVNDIIRGPFVLFCDEADVHVKGWNETSDVTSTGPLMKQLHTRAVSVVKITATPFALWNQEGASQKTITMNTPDNYRGLTETEWVFSSVADAKSVKNGNAVMVTGMLDNMVHDLRPRVESPTRRYMTILINGPTTIAKQNKMAQAIVRQRPQWNAYVMNSDGGQSSIKQATRNDMISTEMVTISALYDKFERENSDDFQVNIIVACLTAARAISFRPTSRRVGTGGLHGMIFFPSQSCHAAQLIQFMRVWGKYDEDYPMIRVNTTEVAYNKLYSEITHNLKGFADATSETGLSREQIEGVPVINVGLHDRRKVDDTTIADKMSMLKKEFATENEVREFLAEDFGNEITKMTERMIRILRTEIDGGFQYGEHINRSRQHSMTSELKSKVAEHNVPLGNGFQVCWHNTRYEDHHTMTRRYTQTRSGQTLYMSQVVAGSGDENDNHVNIVVWKPEYSRLENSPAEEWTLERFNTNRAYIFQTTKNTWRYYTPNEKRVIGLLTH